VDGFAVPAEACLGRGVLDHLLGGHVHAAGVRVGVGLDVALVEQLVERLAAGDVAQVVQDLVPEARVQQVQDGVLDTARRTGRRHRRSRALLAVPGPIQYRSSSGSTTWVSFVGSR
jgi:hypothetical protein